MPCIKSGTVSSVRSFNKRSASVINYLLRIFSTDTCYKCEENGIYKRIHIYIYIFLFFNNNIRILFALKCNKCLLIMSLCVRCTVYALHLNLLISTCDITFSFRCKYPITFDVNAAHYSRNLSYGSKIFNFADPSAPKLSFQRFLQRNY